MQQEIKRILIPSMWGGGKQKHVTVHSHHINRKHRPDGTTYYVVVVNPLFKKKKDKFDAKELPSIFKEVKQNE